MALATLSGRVSGLSRGTDYSYAASGQNGPVAIKNQIITMRLNGTPATFKSRALVSIDDGDMLAAAGTSRQGTFEAVALRNLTTSATYHPSTTGPMVLGGLLILLGLPLIVVLGLGLFFIAFGGYVVWKCLQVRKAAAMLQDLDDPTLRAAMRGSPRPAP